jgi:hypothetical protein
MNFEVHIAKHHRLNFQSPISLFAGRRIDNIDVIGRMARHELVLAYAMQHDMHHGPLHANFLPAPIGLFLRQRDRRSASQVDLQSLMLDIYFVPGPNTGGVWWIGMTSLPAACAVAGQQPCIPSANGSLAGIDGASPQPIQAEIPITTRQLLPFSCRPMAPHGEPTAVWIMVRASD